jgi:hypothetical protein
MSVLISSSFHVENSLVVVQFDPAAVKTLLMPGVVAHAWNPNTWEDRAGGSQVQDQLGYLVKLSSKTTVTKILYKHGDY